MALLVSFGSVDSLSRRSPRRCARASYFVALCCRFACFRSFFEFFFLFPRSCAFCCSSLRPAACSVRFACFSNRLRCFHWDLVSLVSERTPVMFSCRCFRLFASLRFTSLRRSASSRFACRRAFDLAFFAAFALASAVARSNRSCRRHSICISSFCCCSRCSRSSSSRC